MAKDYIKINTPLDLIYYRGAIHISYTYYHKIFRYKLLKIEERLFLPKICALKYDDNVYDCKRAVKDIEEKLPLINQALIALTADIDPKDKTSTITKQGVDAYIEQHTNIIKTKAGFIEDFSRWIETFREKKKQEDILAGKEPRKIHPTVKDYVSARNLLKDFQHDNFNDRIIQYKDFDNDFITDLIAYAWEERPDNEEDYTYRTKGNLSNKTINKRFDCIFTFIDNFYQNRINELQKPRLETLPRKIIRLDKNDLNILSSLEIPDTRLATIRDYLLFLCLTGLRFSDFVRLDRTFYHEDTNEIVLKATKTSAECHIFLFDKAKEIAFRHDFKFNEYSNQSLNRAIHELLDKYDLFSEDTTLEYMQKGRKVCSKKRRDWITCHAGRRSYISIMVENGLGLYELMSTTGHKKIDTLKFYIDRFGESRRDKFLKVNEKLNIK